jgi:hypothetical protein
MKKTLIYAALLAGLVSTGCKKDKMDPNEEELITTLKVTLTEQGAGTVTTFQFKDPDGDAGNPPTQFDEIIVKPNKTYTCVLQVLNESVSPAEDITDEIKAEDTDHQFYYTVSGANMTVIGLDNDKLGLPLGVTSTWVTTTASTGKIQITLKHKPGIKAAGDPVSKGDTDIELPNSGFTLKIQ